MQVLGNIRENFLKTFLVFVSVYFPTMIKIPLSIDAEYATLDSHNLAWVGQGRWATYLLTYILPYPLMPYFTVAFFGVCISISYIIFVSASKMKFSYEAIIAFVAFAYAPIWITLVEFPGNINSAGVAFFLCAVAVYMITFPKGFLFILSQVLFVAFAIGVYQSFLFVYISMVICLCILSNDSKDRCRILLKAMLISIFSTALYYVTSRLFVYFYDVNTVYINSFINIEGMMNNPLHVIVFGLQNITSIFIGDRSIFGLFIWASPILIILSLLHFMFEKRSFAQGIFYLALLLSPFPLLYLSGGDIPTRTLIAVPVVIWFAAFVALSTANTLRRTLAVAAVLMLWLQSAALVAQYQATRELISQFDQTNAGLIYSRIVSEADREGPYTVDFFGALKPPHVFPVNPTSTANGSFFSWDNGNPQRIRRYMQLLGYEGITLLPKEVRLQLMPLYQQMPSWPANGSVSKQGDVILVKLGPEPGYY